jgi:hypothetical protein
LLSAYYLHGEFHLGPIYGSGWPTFCCDKKVKRLLMFKLAQQHTNNWEVSKIFIPTTILPL